MIFVLVLFLNTLFAQQLYINEVVSDNDNIVFDFEGDNPDWVELYNPNDFDVNLLNYTLSDELKDPFKWTFPEITIKAKSYLVVFCSEKDTLVNGELHTNFKISSDSEELFLYDNGLKVKDKKRLDFVELPPLTENQAYGKLPDGNGKLSYLSKNSPGETNHYSDEIICNIESGFYETDTIEVELKSTMGYEIRYTLDGTDPNENSPLYTGPIKLGNSSDKPNTYSEIPTSAPDSIVGFFTYKKPKTNIDKIHILKIITFNNKKKASDLYIANYFIGKYNNYKGIQIISLVVDSLSLFGYEEGIYVPGKLFNPSNPYWTGNFLNISKESEKLGHITYFNKNNKFQYSQNIKLNILGGGSRVLPQKSLKIIGENIKGPDELRFDLINSEINEYKNIKLKSVMGVTKHQNLCQNEFAKTLADDLNFEKLNFNNMVLFINGEYWGLHTLMEHKNEDYVKKYHNLGRDSVEIVSHYHSALEEIKSHDYKILIDYLNQNSLSIDENYNYIYSKIDIPSLIDYYIFEIIIANYDWPLLNYRLWKTKNSNSKWRPILYDLDGAFDIGLLNHNMFEHSIQNEHSNWPNAKESTLIFRKLIDNNEFIQDFEARLFEIVENSFNIDFTYNKFLEIRNLYLKYIPKNYERWFYPPNFDNKWVEKGNSEMFKFLNERPKIVLNQYEDFKNILSYDLDLCPDNQCDNNKITLFPNPTNGEFSIRTDTKFKICDLIIYSSVGKKIKVLTNEIISENKIFNLSDLPNGIYFIKFENNLGQFTFEKLIINK